MTRGLLCCVLVLLVVVIFSHISLHRKVGKLNQRLDTTATWQEEMSRDYSAATYNVAAALKEKPYILVRQKGTVVTELPPLGK